MSGATVYAYADGDPVSLTDPFGLMAWGDPIPEYIANPLVGLGDGASFGLTSMLRNAIGYGSGFDKCSLGYRAADLAGGLISPLGRFAYIADVGKLASKIPNTVGEALALSAERNAFKAYYRGWFAKLFTDYKTAGWAEQRFLERGGEQFAASAGSSNRFFNGLGAFGFGKAVGTAISDSCGCSN